jgi:predicted secreted Zn-dependent protease
MRQVSVSDAGSDRFAATTQWQLRWDFRVEAPPGGSCRVVSAATSLDIRMTLPRWTQTKDAPPALVKRWSTFADALRKHENGHRDIAIEAAHAVAARAAAVPAEKDCTTLRTNVSRIADDTLREFKDKESSYDVTTMHGRTQGATFP